MMYLTSKLLKYNIDATDGEMGKIHDLYFDDKKWAIRYAVVDTRKWLPSGNVLLSPTAFVNMNEQEERVEVEYDKDTVRNSPSVPAEVSISKDLETSLTGYYGWSRYWLGGMLWGAQDHPISHIHDDIVAEDNLRDQLQINEYKDEHDLRSVNETIKNRVHANNGRIGEVVDMVFDDEYWKVRFLVVDMDEFPARDKFFLINPDTIQSVEWFEGDIYVDTDLEVLKGQKSYNSREEIIAEL